MRWVITDIDADSVYSSSIEALTAEDAFNLALEEMGTYASGRVGSRFIVAPAKVAPGDGQRLPHAGLFRIETINDPRYVAKRA